MFPEELLECHPHKKTLKKNDEGTKFLCGSGCEFPILKDIPRFVPLENYASSFGLQWNEYRKTQLDSFTGVPVSRTRLERMMGGNLAAIKGKTVLEAGCGAGRFTEVMLDAGARVCAVDLSTAVEANYDNCKKYENYFVCQANILEMPLKASQFDIVVCVGVIQHTPDPEQTITVLCSYVKPGGMLVIDHYTHGYGSTLPRKILRFFLKKSPKQFSLRFCQNLTSFLWPLHVQFQKYKKFTVVKAMRRVFLWLSPVVDHQDGYPEIGTESLKVWAALDTHDTLTDYYKHLRSADEIRSCLAANGMADIVTEYAGNGVEARAVKPVIRNKGQ